MDLDCTLLTAGSEGADMACSGDQHTTRGTELANFSDLTRGYLGLNFELSWKRCE